VARGAKSCGAQGHVLNFLGGKRSDEDCLAEETAAREMYEESGGALLWPGHVTQDAMRQWLEAASHASTFIRCGRYVLFLLDWEALPRAERLAGALCSCGRTCRTPSMHAAPSLPDMFSCVPQEVRGRYPVEMTSLHWVPLSALMDPFTYAPTYTQEVGAMSRKTRVLNSGQVYGMKVGSFLRKAFAADSFVDLAKIVWPVEDTRTTDQTSLHIFINACIHSNRRYSGEPNTTNEEDSLARVNPDSISTRALDRGRRSSFFTSYGNFRS
jgi:hypothetical protein